MVTVLYSKHFLSAAARPPQDQRKKLSELLELLRENPYDAKLHTKHLTGKLSGLYSFRITRDWRVIFKFYSSSEIQLVEVAHRRDIYR